MGGLRWTHKTTRNLAAALRRRGVQVVHVTVARLLRAQKCSLRSNRKRLGGTKDPDRDRQFRLLGRRRRQFQRRGWPIISVDRKKKNWWVTSRTAVAVRSSMGFCCRASLDTRFYSTKFKIPEEVKMTVGDCRDIPSCPNGTTPSVHENETAKLFLNGS